MSVSSLDLPRELQQFYEAQRIIVMDAIRCSGEGSLMPIPALTCFCCCDVSGAHLASYTTLSVVTCRPSALCRLLLRTDFKKNSLSTASAISHWVSSALADTSVSRRLSLGDTGWERAEAGSGGGPEAAPCWVSGMARWVQMCPFSAANNNIAHPRMGSSPSSLIHAPLKRHSPLMCTAPQAAAEAMHTLWWRAATAGGAPSEPAVRLCGA